MVCNFSFYLSFLLGILILTGCVSSPPKSNVSERAGEHGAVRAQGLDNHRPDWVDGESMQYPQRGYLTGVGTGSHRLDAEESAYAALALVFRADVRSHSKTREQYAETTNRRGTEFIRHTQLEQMTSVSTEKMLENVTIAERWISGADNSFYALAVLDRQKSGALLHARILALDEDIALLRQKGSETADKIETVQTLYRAIDLLSQREVLNTELKIVSPTGEGIEPQARSVQLKQELQNFIANKIKIGVAIGGVHGTQIRSAIIEALTREGFSVEDNHRLTDGLDIVIKGTVMFDQSDLPRWKFVNWATRVDMLNTASEKIFASMSEQGREGHLSFSEAELKAVKAAQRVLADRFRQQMLLFVIGEK